MVVVDSGGDGCRHHHEPACSGVAIEAKEMSEAIERILDAATEPTVRGYLHRPESPNGDALILAHGAGSNAQSPLLVAVAGAFAEAGLTVLRIDLPFRQARPHGPPFPAVAAKDRQGIRRAAELMRRSLQGRVFLGGHSYGGRQATMLAAEEPELASGLVLLSYPLHPPRKPEQKTGCAFSEVADAGAVCAWKSGSVWIAKGDAGGVEVDSGADGVSDSRRGWARSEGDGVGEDSSGEVCGVLWWRVGALDGT